MADNERSAASKEFERAAGTMEDIQRDLQAVRDDVARLATQISALLSATGSDAVHEVADKIDRIRQGLDEVVSEAGEKGRDAAGKVRDATENVVEAMEESVRKHPVGTLAIALGLGFLFGVTWRR